MEKTVLGLVCILGIVGCSSAPDMSKETQKSKTLNVVKKIDFKKYDQINIEKNLSIKELNAYAKDSKKMGITGIVDPTFTCKDAGYINGDIVGQAMMYGTKRKDGNINVSGEGDFKVYSYVTYVNSNGLCMEKTYEKDDVRYGKNSFALMSTP